MQKYALIVILLLAAIIRLVTLSKLMVFTPDEEYLLYITQTIVKHFHIIWIGVSALGFDFYMGPLWIYIIYPFVALFQGNPLVLGVISSLLGVGAVFLLYLLGTYIFNKKVGLVAALLYASSALMVYYDQQPYPPGVPFLSLLMAISLYLTSRSNKWWIVFAISYGMVFHIHLSLFLIIIVALYWAFIQRKKLNKKILILSFLAFIITISPLIAFDYFHKASNITTPIRILQSSSKYHVNIDLGLRFNSLLQSFSRVWYLTPNRNNADEILYPCITNPLSTTTQGSLVLSAITLIGLLYFSIKKATWTNPKTRLIVLLSLSFLIPFIALPVIHPIEYYLLGFFPLLFLVMASLIESFSKKIRILAYIVIILFVIHGIFTVFTASGDFGLATKNKLIGQVMNIVGQNSYDLDQDGACHKYEGWRYLFSNYARKPAHSSEDSVFSWLYPQEVSSSATEYSVLMTEKRAPTIAPLNYKYMLEQGGFKAYVYQH